MRNKIFNSLLITGITTAIIVFIVLGVFYYQGMQERRTEELINLNKVVSSVITTEDESNSKNISKNFQMRDMKNTYSMVRSKEQFTTTTKTTTMPIII